MEEEKEGGKGGGKRGREKGKGGGEGVGELSRISPFFLIRPLLVTQTLPS
jgi:hypothetical protein